MMTLGDTGRVLTLASGYDNRKLDEAVAIAWHAIIGNLDFNDCCHVVREHYTRTRDWIMPADIIDGVKRLRTDRLSRIPDPIPNADPDQPRQYLEAIRDTRRAIGDGQPAPPERIRLEGTRGLPDGFTDAFRDARSSHARIEAPAAPAAAEQQAQAEAAARAEIAQLHEQQAPAGDEDQAEAQPPMDTES